MGRRTSRGRGLAAVLPWCCHPRSTLPVHCHPCSTLPGLQHRCAQHDGTQEPWYVGGKHSKPPRSRGMLHMGGTEGSSLQLPKSGQREAFGCYRWVREVSLSKQPMFLPPAPQRAGLHVREFPSLCPRRARGLMPAVPALRVMLASDQCTGCSCALLPQGPWTHRPSATARELETFPAKPFSD